MKNVTSLFFMGVLCLLLTQNVVAQEKEKKAPVEGAKVMVKQEYTVKKMQPVEPKVTNESSKNNQKLAKSTPLSTKTTTTEPDQLTVTRHQIQKLEALLDDAKINPNQYSVAEVEKLQEALKQKQLLLDQLLQPVKK